MQGVIPAAGRGTRLLPLTRDLPKPLLPVAGRPILEHGFRQLDRFGVEELVVVIGWRGDEIVRTFGSQWRGTPIVYVRQAEPLGLAHALLQAEPVLDGPFLALHGDVIYGPDVDLAPVVDGFTRQEGTAASILTEKLPPERVSRGAVQVDAEGRVLALAEYPDAPARAWGRVAAGFYVFAPEICEACRSIPPSSAGEYELPRALTWLLERDHQIVAWDLPGSRVNVNTARDLTAAEELVTGTENAED